MDVLRKIYYLDDKYLFILFDSYFVLFCCIWIVIRFGMVFWLWVIFKKELFILKNILLIYGLKENIL